MKRLQVAIVHDYLNQMGGAERVVAVLHRMFPDAPIYTTIADRAILQDGLENANIRTSWMQRIPGIRRRFKGFFWLYPFAVASMDLSGYDLVISSSSAFAKGAPVPKQAIHICYCHAPMRFAWSFDAYMDGMNVPRVIKWATKRCMELLKAWDRKTTAKVDMLIANSTEVKERIRRFYDQAADVIFPPVELERFPASEALRDRVQPDAPEHEPFYLVVSRLVSYKRIELAVEVCSRLGIKLVVVGDGPDRKRLEAMAGPTVRFEGRLPDEQVTGLMRNCQALLFPGLEDFGITPLEANVCGRPVIAFEGGGALDTIVPGLNGLFFSEATVESLMDALQRFSGMTWDRTAIRRHAERFGIRRFEVELLKAVEKALTERYAGTKTAGETIHPTT